MEILEFLCKYGGAISGWILAVFIILYWLLKYIPDERARYEKLQTSYAADRKSEQEVRHETNNAIQVIFAEMQKGHKDDVAQMHREHKDDAEKDRQAFLIRSNDIGGAVKALAVSIDNQTVRLEVAMRNSCNYGRYMPHPAKEPRGET